MAGRRPSVCVIGAGAAGLTLANRLAYRGWRVTIVESGPLQSSQSFEGVNGVEVVGTPHRGLLEGRFRGWGGSTARWGGQLWAWEPYEFGPRPKLGVDGWPIAAAEVLSHTPEAFTLLGLRHGALTPEEAFTLGVRPPDLSATDFTLKFSTWLPWRKRNLGRTVGKSLQASENVARHGNTTAVSVVMDASDSHATGVRVRGSDGSEAVLRADVVVIAAGAVETTRLLFASEAVSSEPCGRWPWLGKGFMDHLSVRTSRFHPRQPTRFGEMFAPVFAHGAQHTPRMLLNPALLERETMLGCYGHWEVRSPADSPLMLLRNKLRAFQSGDFMIARHDVPRLTRGMQDLVSLVKGMMRDHRRYFERDAEVYLRIDSEQLPDPDSRLVPTGTVDPFGLPRVVLDWRISPIERHTIARATFLLREELEKLRVGQFDAPTDPFAPTVPWGEIKGDSFHMMGGTRMARRPECGVVDTNNKVVGLDNLYVASTSTFPTGGMANPTLLLICLSLRLADHLSSAY